MPSQKNEYGHDNSRSRRRDQEAKDEESRSQSDDQAKRLQNSRVSNEQLARMIEINGDKLDHLHQMEHRIMAKLEDVTRELGELRIEQAETKASVGELLAMAVKQGADIADLKQQIIDLGGAPTQADLDKIVADLDELQAENNTLQEQIKAVTNPSGGSTGGIPT